MQLLRGRPPPCRCDSPRRPARSLGMCSPSAARFACPARLRLAAFRPFGTQLREHQSTNGDLWPRAPVTRAETFRRAALARRWAYPAQTRTPEQSTAPIVRQRDPQTVRQSRDCSRETPSLLATRTAPHRRAIRVTNVYRIKHWGVVRPSVPAFPDRSTRYAGALSHSLFLGPPAGLWRPPPTNPSVCHGRPF